VALGERLLSALFTAVARPGDRAGGGGPGRRAWPLRPGVAGQGPLKPAGLGREEAIALLAELQEARRDLHRLETGLRRLLEGEEVLTGGS